MADTVSKPQRSRTMAAVRSRGNRSTEERLVSLMRKHRITGWRRHLNMSGKPDFVFKAERVVVFVDGCFWHGCPKHLRMPKTNVDYWETKIFRNMKRDKSIRKQLRKSGWKVLRLWEHELKSEARVTKRLGLALS